MSDGDLITAAEAAELFSRPRMSTTREAGADQQSDEDRESEARSILTRAGFMPNPLRRYSVDMLEALAGVIETWGDEGEIR